LDRCARRDDAGKEAATKVGGRSGDCVDRRRTGGPSGLPSKERAGRGSPSAGSGQDDRATPRTTRSIPETPAHPRGGFVVSGIGCAVVAALGRPDGAVGEQAGTERAMRRMSLELESRWWTLGGAEVLDMMNSVGALVRAGQTVHIGTDAQKSATRMEFVT